MKQVETLDDMTVVYRLITALVKGVHEGFENSHQWIVDNMTVVYQLITALVKGVHEGFENSHQWIVDNVMAHHLYNCWIWPFVSFVWVPAWMTQVVVSLSRS
jgi:hypothetical protein